MAVVIIVVVAVVVIVVIVVVVVIVVILLPSSSAFAASEPISDKFVSKYREQYWTFIHSNDGRVKSMPKISKRLDLGESIFKTYSSCCTTSILSSTG